MATLLEPTAEGATAMFKRLEEKFPTQTLGQERWYLIAVRYTHQSFPTVPGPICSLIAADLSPLRLQPLQEVVNLSSSDSYTHI